MKNPKNKKMAPSRERYENGHPTVSARMPIDKRNRLVAVLERLGLTLGELLIKFADEQEIITRPLAEARKEGFIEARKMFGVWYPCQKCGRQILINSQKEKVAAARHMVEEGWAHEECPEETKPAD
ncbi:MAG: hypothetical protein Q8O43_01730 [Dehalococcoidia bacterium]|nr:hypothetical protein [Dehalococcoidia bacterium]